jgi:hypothetical protein
MLGKVSIVLLIFLSALSSQPRSGLHYIYFLLLLQNVSKEGIYHGEERASMESTWALDVHVRRHIHRPRKQHEGTEVFGSRGRGNEEGRDFVDDVSGRNTAQ